MKIQFRRFLLLSAFTTAFVFGPLKICHCAKVFFVTDEVQHLDGDESVIERLESLGHTVEVVDHLDAMDSDPTADGAELIVISSSTTSSNVLDHFSAEPVPIINWEEALWDDLYLSNNEGGGGQQDSIDVVDISHPLAGMMGLTEVGELLVRDFPIDFHFGGSFDHADDLQVIALQIDGERPAIAVVDEGGTLNDGSTAAATRIGLFYGNDGIFEYNDAGLAIFDGAVAYALGGNREPGDFDGDGALTISDLDALGQAITNGGADTSFDLNGDGQVNTADQTLWVKELKNTWIGDANLDGEFNSADFVAVFTAGQYEDGIDGNSSWVTGDWNGDQEFDSGDFVAAFTDGGFELGPRGSSAVPEPETALLLIAGIAAIWRRR